MKKIKENYDFTDETANNLLCKINTYMNNQTATFEKYIIYKMYLECIDPDVMSYQLQEIYKKKWNEKYLKSCKKTEDSVFSDTMTSVQGLLHSYYDSELSNKNEKIKSEIKKYKEEKNLKLFSFSKKTMFTMFTEIKKYPEFERTIVRKNEVNDFISIYHTIGNYIPVPQYFNKNRGSKGIGKGWKNYDMWDLTLLKIIEYYDLKKENKDAVNILMQLLHCKNKNSDIIASTKNWLDCYENKKEFIDKNYLNMYVDKNYNIKNDFRKIHTWENPEPIDHIKYFKMISEAIDERAKLILKEEK